VYKDAFLAHTKLTLRLDLLVRSSLKDKLLQMPSWVPNFFTENVVGLTYAVGTRASGISSAQIKYFPPDTLQVTGTHFDTIHGVGKKVVQTWEDLFQAARDIGKERLLAECYPTGEKMLDAFAWAVSSALLHERFPAVSTYFTVEKWKEIILASVSDNCSIKGVGAYSGYPTMMLSAIKGKRIFFTLEGYIGYAPEEVKPGKLLSLRCFLRGLTYSRRGPCLCASWLQRASIASTTQSSEASHHWPVLCLWPHGW
jgi:hypothetical protein